MNGLVYMLNKAGESLAAAEAEIERLRRENAILRENAKPEDKP
jgi:hypothetical protein